MDEITTKRIEAIDAQIILNTKNYELTVLQLNKQKQTLIEQNP